MRQPTNARYLDQTGFTLLQLVIVIAIVGLLGAVAVTAAWREVTRTREAARVHALREVQEALELYWLDNQAYPSTSNFWRWSCNNTYGTEGYIPNLAPKYIAALPQDPLSCNTHEGYYYKSDGTDYKFQNHNESSVQPITGLLLNFLDPAQPAGHFAVYTPGASSW